jgi:hypothetical protein
MLGFPVNFLLEWSPHLNALSSPKFRIISIIFGFPPTADTQLCFALSADTVRTPSHPQLWVRNVTTHAQKPDFVFRAKRTSPFKSARCGGGGVSSVDRWPAEGGGIRGSNVGYTVFRGSVKSIGYPLHSPVSTFTSPSRASPCAITFQLASTTSLSLCLYI